MRITIELKAQRPAENTEEYQRRHDAGTVPSHKIVDRISSNYSQLLQ